MAASVRADGVWKQFQLRKDRADSVGQLLVQMIPGRKRPKAEHFWALQDVSFEVKQGRSLGVIGNNGSGKSTLLKLLTRTMQPTQGSVDLRGRMSALIELGAGFHPDFTGRENIILNASILGIGRKEIEKSMNDIIDFAAIRPFIDVPVKYYSSGMQARLGFAVAINVDPEILIVDEVLAVGDEAFQQKCMDRIFEMKRSGISILLVSHDLGSIERLMDSAIWIDQGVVRAQGNPRDVVHGYRTFLGAASSPPAAEHEVATLPKEAVYVAAAEIRVPGASGSNDPAPGDPLEISLQVANETGSPIDGYLSVSIRRPDGLEIAEISGMRDGRSVGLRPGLSTIVLSAHELRLASGSYEVDVAVFDIQGKRLAEAKAISGFRVQGTERTTGVILVPHDWRAG
ncbi:MAG: polysaccharide ABC transporter ATP-binding protein [Thermaerobacter sp.]|nr:polysaccharide ABC transporter ATP-binding protein [Thermaerobacter sp.]